MRTISNTKFFSSSTNVNWFTFSLTLLFAVLTSFSYAQIANSIPEVIVQSGHQTEISSVAISPDRKYALSGSKDYTVKLWEIATGKEMKNLIGHAESITTVGFTADGKYAFSGSWDKKVLLWDLASGKNVKTFSGHDSDYEGGVLAATCSPDSKFIAAGRSDKKVYLLDLMTGQEVRVFNGHTEAVEAVCFSPDGKYLLSGSTDKTMKLWNVQTAEQLNTFSGFTEGLISVAFTPDGKYVMGSGNYETKVFDIKSGAEINSQKKRSYAFSPNGKETLALGSNYALEVFDITTNTIVRELKGHSWHINGVSVSADGKQAISCSLDQTIRVWDMATGITVKVLQGHAKRINVAVFSKDGKYVLAGNNENSMVLWDFTTGKALHAFKGHQYGIFGAAFSADGKMAISGSYDKTMKLWDVTTGKEIRTFEGAVNDVASVAFSPDGRYAVATQICAVKVWDISTGKELRTIITYPAMQGMPDHTCVVTSLTISADGKSVLSGSMNRSMVLTDIETGAEIVSCKSTFPVNRYNAVGGEVGHASDIWGVALSADGKYAVSGSSDLTSKLWDLGTGKEIRSFVGHDRSVKAVAISPDGKYVASAAGKYLERSSSKWTSSSPWDIKLWNASTGSLIRTFEGHTDGVQSVSFTPDGKYLLSGSYDGTMRLWNIETGEWTAYLSKIDASEWLTWNSEGYWDSSPHGGELVAMVKGIDCWNIDQFAVTNNRPDIILQKNGCNDQNLIDHYSAQYRKRLRKLNLTEDQLSADYHVPQSKIIDVMQNDKTLNLKFNVSDARFNLKSYNIYVNNVPLFGSYGKAINKDMHDLTASIELIEGDNKVEVSCMNEKGTESYRALTYARYEKPVKGNLYFLGFGVSKYKDPTLNLQYADKDVKDLAAAFEKMKGKKFNNVFIKTYINENVLPDSIKDAKKFLKNAKPDDTFVLFIAGHGVHDQDKEATYYYLTHNANPANLKTTAADFGMIEDLLQGIEPRNKLFLMDACESGEIDDVVVASTESVAGARGLRSRGMKKKEESQATASQQNNGRTYLWDKDRFIYNDLSRRSGAIVFSSSKGGEFSYENSEIQNGLFTKSIIKALTTSSADSNYDKIVTTDELRAFVIKDVAQTSNDLQHPTVDRDNIYQKFGFGIE